MRTARTFGTLVALLASVLPMIGAVGCRNVCAIDPGTPAANLPLGPSDTTGYERGCFSVTGPGEDMMAISCCHFPDAVVDGGVVDCDGPGGHFRVDCAKVLPAEFRWLGKPYGGGQCGDSTSMSEWYCGVYVLNGSVIGSCRLCPPD